jgi:hypothetical protein
MLFGLGTAGLVQMMQTTFRERRQYGAHSEHPLITEGDPLPMPKPRG